MLATASSDAKLERLRELGLDDGINYSVRKVAEEVFMLTEGRGVDVVVESVGGPGLAQMCIRDSIPDGPVVQFLVFERQTDREPWMITYATGYGGTRHLLGTTSQLGSAPMAINPGSTPFVALAALFQSLRETGSALRGNLWSSSIKDLSLIHI